MFKTIALTPMLLALAGHAAAQTARPLDPNCERLLPVAVVAKAAGDTGVSLIPPGPTAGSTCNYAVAGKTVILTVDLHTNATARTFQNYKGSRSYKEGQQAIPGLGDEALVASPFRQDFVVARKGTLVVALAGLLDADQKSPRFGKAHLTRQQLIEFARQMLAKA